jgi:prepilin signal peptidase PulO-like enzyme (type II secretory pathway)
MPLPDPGLLGGGVIAALVGGLFGWTQSAITGRWLAACERGLAEGTAGEAGAAGTAVARSSTILGPAIVVVVGLWWWEVRWFAELPRDDSGAPLAFSFAPVAGRWLAHTLLLWLLAAATWIDFRYRVIPDWVTIPGLLAGLVVAWLAPGTLLPVGAELARPFATPLILPDVLGWAGPLEHAAAERGAWVAAHPAALVAGLVLFSVWWRVGTGPDLAGGDSPQQGDGTTATDAPPAAPWWPRLGLLAVGWLVLSGAWSIGGLRFEAMFTGLVGAVVAGGVVWLTRAGASLALGREAMGLGDVTLMAMVGAWLGWQASVLACFLGVLFGLVHGVVQIVRHRESELPFGPSLCAGTVAVMVGWRPLWKAAAASFAETGQLVGIVLAVVVGTALSLWVWSSLGPPARRVALAAMLLLGALLVGWLMVLQG